MTRRSPNYPPELRERAVRMVAEVTPNYDSQWAAIGAVAQKLGVGSAETVRQDGHRGTPGAGLRRPVQRGLAGAVPLPGPDASLIATAVEAALVATEASGAACGAHAEHHAHCRMHARTAAACAEALRTLQKTFA